MKAFEGEKVKLLISGYNHSGEGVARYQGQVVFIPGALIEEDVLVEFVAEQKGILQGRIHEVSGISPKRVSPFCNVFEECGGCQLQHMSYPAQLRLKEQVLRDALERIGRLTGVQIHPVIGMEEPWRYRNKGHFQVRKQDGRVVLGFYEEDSHQLAGQFCRHLFSERIVSLLAFLENCLTKHSIKVASTAQPGLCRILLRESRANGEILIVFITTDKRVEAVDTLVQEIRAEFPQVVGVSVSSQARRVGPVLGQKNKVVWGKGEFVDSLGPFSFHISVPSFFQINNSQAEVLYREAIKYASLFGTETVVDAYCGIGTISLFLAEKAGRVIGIESVREAVEDARRNAAENGVNNAEFICGEAEKEMTRLIKEGIRPDVVVVDPPRKGCDRKLLECLLDTRPARIVYVSCNPATLARDLRVLVEGGYAVAEVQPVDLFPQTSHVEACVLLVR